MSFRDALDLVPDDMPDGAAFAMAHEFAGLEYGDGFDEIIGEVEERIFGSPPPRKRKKRRRSKNSPPTIVHDPTTNPAQAHKPIRCTLCDRRFAYRAAGNDHARDCAKRPTPEIQP